LNCDLYPPGAHAESPLAFFPPTAVEACRQRLETSADLTRYTFDYFARDLEDVRRGLGYAKLNMFAGSYGTRAAQVYMRAFPSSVRTAFLGSVVPIDIEGPLDFAKTEQTALDRMTANCAADPRCRAAFPHLGGELKEIVARMDSGDVRIRLPGQTAPVALARGRALEWFRSQLYRPHDAAALPWIIHRAFEGDWKPLVDGIVSGARGLKDDLSIGLFFSITCNEDMPFVREADVAAAVRGTYLGDYRLRQQQAACRLWPRAVLPEGYRSPVHSSVPTLFVTGDQDGGTPLWFTPHVAKNFSRRAIVVVRGQGHTEWNGCVAGKYEDLVRRGSVAGLQTTACPAIPLPPFKT
jgi:pimeloyl-ACP methyl ester carboxylesterase